MLSETRTRTLADASVVSETTRFEYDALNRLTKTIYPDLTESTVEYDAVGNQTATVDQAGYRTDYDYDTYGRLLTTTYHDGTSSTATYDAEGNKLSDTDRNGHTTSYSYDALSRLTRTTYPDNSYSETEYDAAGRVSAEVDTNGNRTEYTYDAAGRRTAVQDALFNVHQFAYDADGNLVQETDARAHSTSYTYNALDQKTQTTFADASSIQQGFDTLGRRITQTDQANIVTSYSYDGLGRLDKVTDALLQETSYSYDEAGNKLTQTDAEGRTTRWTYDALGRVSTRQLPAGQTEYFTYDDQGNVATHTDFNNQITRYTYDVNGRVTRTDYHDGTFETVTYDNAGNRISVTTAQGTTTYDYDSRHRLISESQANGAVLAYEYDGVGNKTKLTTTVGADVRVETYTYDALNRLETVTDANNGVTSYGYDAVGNRTSVSYPNGTSTTYVYDALNRLTQVSHYSASGALMQQFDYTLHSTGRRAQIDELSGRSTAYSYDDLYRLTDEVVSDSINGNYSANYQYDAVGNRTYSTINGVSTAYTYDLNDRITQQGGTTYTYDENGNTLTETIDGVTTTFTYNAKNKLVQVEKGGTISSYAYNADGIRVAQSAAGVPTRYIVDSNRDYAQVLIELDDSDNVDVQYTYGDDLISQDRANGQSYYHYDGLGSTRALSDATGNLSDSYDYEAFGELLSSSGSSENNYLFTGEQFDANLDQYYLRARYYDPGVGRFTQMDTWMGRNHDPITLHKYLYANADAVNYTDPSGNFGLFEASVTNTIATELSLMQIDAGFSALDTAFGSLGIDDSTVDDVRTATQIAGITALGAGGIKLLVMLSKKAKDCLKRNCNFDIWNRISPTGSNYPGSVVPVTFRYSSNSGHSVWVNSNATEHLAEYAQSLARTLTPDKVRLGTQLQIKSLGSAIDTATKNGVPLNTSLNIDGWQLEFRQSDGDELPVLIHALYGG